MLKILLIVIEQECEKKEEGMKNMFVSGNNEITDLYLKFDNIGDFTNKSKACYKI